MGSRNLGKLRLSGLLNRGQSSTSSLPPPVSRLETMSGSSRGFAFALAGFLGGSTFIYYLINPDRLAGSRVRTLGLDTTEKIKRQLSAREKRFLMFSSAEYQGQIYMTPQDFLESVVEAEPKPRLKRRRLTGADIEALKAVTPTMEKNDMHFFRNLGGRGIISYSEYLFLLTILIKPTSGFKIAFSMLDQDGNEKIDKEEFKTLETIFSTAARERREADAAAAAAATASVGELQGSGSPAASGQDSDEFGLQKVHPVDTSLLLHFFGRHGNRELKYDDFFTFMDNLQTEVLHMEYGEFSKGAATIPELDFARILLRYTFLNTEDYHAILERLSERLEEERGITFAEFKDFCQFLNNLDDFQIAMRMYTLADKAISQEEFSRAVHICTGKRLSPHLVSTVFKIFDDDGDGLLSYQEFVAMMKDRIHRGLKSYSRQEGWAGFKQCVKQEMKS